MIENNLRGIDDSEDTLGGRLVAARESNNLTTAQLARRIGVKTETMSNWENDRDEPRANRLVIIAGVLNVSPTWLLCGAGESPSGQSTSADTAATVRAAVHRVREYLAYVNDELEKIEQKLDRA